VQFLKLAGDQTFLEFVSPDSPESKLVSASKRGGLNHLCFTADNFEQTIVQLEESGMSVISEPKPGRAFGGRRICWLVGEDPRLNSWKNSLMMTYAFRWRQSITHANSLL
jgi:methylmalonyl-CoA/ethylmalonyl-CoA epimerase